MIKIAKEYRDKWGFSVIPLLGNKKPAIPSWLEYQKRYATDKELEEWFITYPATMIGIVTGKLSNLAVIDIDRKDLVYTPVERSNAPLVSTPRGYHYYFKYQEGITNTVNIGGEKIDVRGEGGYVVAPPSITKEGKAYSWCKGIENGLTKFPIEILSQPGYPIEKPIPPVTTTGGKFIQGRRDEDLFHVAHTLVKGGMTNITSLNGVLMRLASTCDPPETEKVAREKVQSAINRAIRAERPWVMEIKEWVAVTKGWFSVNQCYTELFAVTKEDKCTVRQNLIRLRDSGVIESDPKKNGWYRKIELECEEIDWRNAPTDDVPIKFPLHLHDLVTIYPGNIIIIAGESNAGKTAFLLDFIRLNMDKYTMHYFNSEMGASELKIRLGLFRAVEDWKFTAWERSGNFTDVIRPDDINVIDFLDVTDEFWKVGAVIKGIHEKLGKGLAIIGLQKNTGYYNVKTGKWVDRDLGRGGALSIEKSRLYVSMGRGRMKIVKAKNWKGDDNPNGKMIEFKLYKGNEFSTVGYWRRPDEET